MKAIVLAAGKGTRLRPLTDTCPKPMIPLGGKPLLEHIVRLLAGHGFDHLYINLHHLPEVIRGHFGDGQAWGIELTYAFEKELLGTAGAVRRMAAGFDAPFLVYYGDNLCNVDIGALWEQHLRTGALATVGLLWMDEPTTRGIVGLDATGRIRRMLEKPRPEEVFEDYLVNGGIYALSPAVLDHLPPGASDFGQDIFPRLLAAGLPLYGHRLQGQLLSTDTPARYAHACRQIHSGAFALP